MIEKEYKYREFRAVRHSFHIYCIVYNSLVFIYDNTKECATKHLNECIAKIEQRCITYFRTV